MKKKLFEVVTNLESTPEEKIIEGVKNPAIDQWAYRIHDQDLKEDGTLKKPHWHIELKLKDTYDSKYVGQWFGVEDNFVEPIKGKRYIHGCRYLIHANAPDKYQYDVEGVKANFDFAKFIKDNDYISDSKKRLREITEKIMSGEIRKWNYLSGNYITVPEMQKWERPIKIAFKCYDDLYISKGDRDMDVIYICGESGIGKTTWAKEYVENQGKSVYVSSGSNDPFDGYKGEEAVILDEMSPNTFLISDLLKVTDNHTASTAKSRFFNKRLYCDLMIITTTVPIKDFFKESNDKNKGSPIQLYRRCERMFVLRKDSYDLNYYDQEKKDYVLAKTIKGNPIAKKVSEFKKKTMQEKLDEDLKFIKSVSGGEKDLYDNKI